MAKLEIPINIDWNDIRKALEERDIVEVVRCKECKYRDPEDKKCDCGHDIRWQLPRNDNWYCADGERRELWTI